MIKVQFNSYEKNFSPVKRKFIWLLLDYVSRKQGMVKVISVKQVSTAYRLQKYEILKKIKNFPDVLSEK